ncbi:MAG: DUF58 domain-containing protein [Actinomycetota bacterium]
MLTRRGWSLLGASTGLYVGSRVLGLVQLVVLAACGLLLLAAAAIWVRLHPLDLVARRHLRERLQVGVDGRVDLELAPARGRRTPTISVSDSFDRGRRSARFLVSPLHAGEAARAAYRIPTDRRGRFELGPLHATLADAFGLASRTRRVLGTEEVIVYPRVFDIAPLPESGGDDHDRDLRRAHGRLDPGGEFLTLRDYEPGDDLRRVHWRSTARRDRLMVRQNEARRRAPVLVMLDVRPAAHDRASFERAVEACGSIVTALERAGRPHEVILSTGVSVGTQGRRHLASVMDELAVVECHGPDRIVAASTRVRTAALVAIMGCVHDDDGAACSVLLRNGGTMTVVATAADDVTIIKARRVRPAVVRYGSERPLAQAWNQAVLTWQRSARLPSSASHARG